jgi:mRNA interferase RelE/StbE
MPQYTIKIKNSAQKELDKLQLDDYVKVSSSILSLANDPYPVGYKKLKNFKIGNKDGYRIRQGDFRVIYTIDGEVLEIFVVKIGHRREVYD